jgi:pimeloyl-ACP methyl ester carboxylesterase
MTKEGFVNLNGVKLHYLDWGGTGKALVLLTGLGATSKYYGGLAPKLTKRFKVLGLTRRGHGQSDRPAEYNLDILVEDIRHFLDAMDIKQAILVGHSMAGFEMPLFAIRYPQRVEAIVFMDAIYPKMDSEPDFSDDPTNALPSVEPSADDFASLDAYFAHKRKARPNLV